MKRNISFPALLTAMLILSPLSARSQEQSRVELGEKCPNFSATDHTGSKWVLKKELRQNDYLVVYFYPAAFTGGCTKQACSYRDYNEDLKKLNASVVGISGDSPKTLKLFAMEHELTFTLLSDEDGKIADLFGVEHSKGGTITREIGRNSLELTRGTTIRRWTFVLDHKGTVIYKDAEVNAAEDSKKVFEFLSSL